MIFLQDKFAVEPETLAYAFLPYALVGALLPARLGKLADRFGRKPLMVLGLAVAAVTSFFVPYLGSLVALAALWALQALCYVAGDPAERALVADLTGGDQRGRAYIGQPPRTRRQGGVAGMRLPRTPEPRGPILTRHPDRARLDQLNVLWQGYGLVASCVEGQPLIAGQILVFRREKATVGHHDQRPLALAQQGQEI